MNMQLHHSGHMTGEVPNQAGAMLGGQSQINGNLTTNQIQNPGLQCNGPGVENDVKPLRKCMLQKIFDIISRRRQPSQDMPNRKLVDIARRLEDGLFKLASSKEEYANLSTLESRLHFLIKRYPMGSQNQQFPHGSSSVSAGAMIPTPGFQQTENTNTMGGTSVESSIARNTNALASPVVDPGGLLSTRNTSSGNTHGHQRSLSSLSANVRGATAVSSVGMPRTYQMIPTPGIRNSSNYTDVNASNESIQNLESSNNGTALQPFLRYQNAVNPNNMTLQNISGLGGGGIRSLSQQGPVNAGLGIMRNTMGMINGLGNTDMHSSGTAYENSTRPMHQHFDHVQQSDRKGDVQGTGAAGAPGSGTLYATSASSGQNLNNQSSSALSTRPMGTSSSSLEANDQPGLYSNMRASTVKLHSTDQLEQMGFMSHYSAEGNPAQCHENVQYQQNSQFPSGQLAHQVQLKMHLQDQMFQSNSFCQPQSSTHRASAVKPEFEMDHVDGVLSSQVSEPYQYSDVLSQFHQNSVRESFRDNQGFSTPPSAGDTYSMAQVRTSEHMGEHLHRQDIVVSPRSDFTSTIDGTQPDFATDNHQNSMSQIVHASEKLVPGKNGQDGFNRRLLGEDAAQQNMSSEELISLRSEACRPLDPLRSDGAVSEPKTKVSDQKQLRNQLKWLLFLRHARRCPSPEGKCCTSYCVIAQKLLKHIEECSASRCEYPRCYYTKRLVNHNRQCRDESCPVCVPVKNYLQAHSHLLSNKATKTVEKPVEDTQENLEPPSKRPRIYDCSQSHVPESKNSISIPANDYVLRSEQNADLHGELHAPMVCEITEVKVEIPDIVGQLDHKSAKIKDMSVSKRMSSPISVPISLNNPSEVGDQKLIKTEKHIGHSKLDSCQIPSENATKHVKTKVKGVSMIELFTPEQVRQHIRGLRQWVGQSKAKAERNQALGHSMNENSCQLCALERLAFEPPPIYCTNCGIRIKRNAMYYAAGTGDTRHCFCIPCYNASRGDAIVLDGVNVPKARMEKKKNDEETEEWWVQCDKCEAWQHQICALFNGRRNEGGQAEYTCPNCYIMEVERGERMPLPQSAILGAKDLPRTSLSDHLEQRLYAKLKQEKHERARIQGKNYDEVPSAEELVVRVVSSADKKLEVKPRFLEIFREEKYPIDFPYKSKVVLLFQRIEGVEVFLFGMYVQEFGSECMQPNNRRVYLSYLDSVKYFRPEVKAATGEALRTFVYHEILIGYLEYIKKRGFTSCYIWACPPLKGEDYIIYCHPEIQKTPKSDKLREWYLAMLRKATKENIVVGLTNLYDHFFFSSGECKAKVTAARLPYFDGDYWPGAAEDFIHQLQQEEDGKKPQKGSIKKSISKRALKASGQTDLSGNASKDLLLMRRLGETISPMKEDFIMVHLQHACTHCCILMVSGNRWICKQCKSFQLCDKCHDAEVKLDSRERHPVNLKESHALYAVEIKGVPDDTRDTEFVDSEIFDTRQAFLTLCQGNHYQYDTLRRAKHSSIMVLYHLHNPSAPPFVTQCTICHLDIEVGHGWHCEVCPEFDVCNACYLKDGGRNHPHKLINQQSQSASDKEARQARVMQLKKMLDLLVHASQCSLSNCPYPNCRRVKMLFRHGMTCSVRAVGGCLLCKRMWYLLQLHSRACRESKCNVPRCRDMREHVRRQQQQSDSRRRAAVKEMMRQRAAEASGSSC